MIASHLNRVVVTGLGLVTPLGCGVQHNWQRVLDKSQGGTARPISDEHGLYASLGKAAIACHVSEGEKETDFDVASLPSSAIRNKSRAQQFALHAARQAWNDAELDGAASSGGVDCNEIGVAYGQAMVDVDDVVRTAKLIEAGKSKRISPYFVPSLLANSSAAGISLMFGLRGPNHAVSTACTTGAHSIGDAYNMIRLGMAKGMLCGGGDACISPVTLHGFHRLRAIASTFDIDDCADASRPFDATRSGFVVGEGSGVMMLESMEQAIRRKAKIYAEVVGYGMSGDAHHVTSPDQSGVGAKLCMERALHGISASSSVQYVNAHATSTPMGDQIELAAIGSVIGDGVKVSSSKGALGHLLGGAGSVEAILTILALHHGRIPHTANLTLTDCPTTGVELVIGASIEWPAVERRVAMSNSFGFGGTNATLCFAQFMPDSL